MLFAKHGVLALGLDEVDRFLISYGPLRSCVEFGKSKFQDFFLAYLQFSFTEAQVIGDSREPLFHFHMLIRILKSGCVVIFTSVMLVANARQY